MNLSWVYILSNEHNNVLYTGVTSGLKERIIKHKTGFYKGFTHKYNVHKLVYYESYGDIKIAIAREKQIKGGSREKKIDLIQSVNPEWQDLFELL